MRLRLLVAYHGEKFHGLAPQAGNRTVVGEIAAKVALVTRMDAPPHMVMSGRTDTGVHAWGQVLHVDVPDGTDTAKLSKSLRSMLSPEIVVRSVEVVSVDFDARHSAIWRRYKYTILNDPTPDPWLADTAWHVADPLNIDIMRLGCDPLLGEHDFSSFCGAPEHPGQTNNRRVMSANINRMPADDRLLQFEIVGNAFCRQMVRAITGLLVDIGRGRRTPGEVRWILDSKDRSMAGTLAPPHGLCLWEVGYRPDGV
jgi:tRNA pseudouridine38-40 synthase